MDVNDVDGMRQGKPLQLSVKGKNFSRATVTCPNPLEIFTNLSLASLTGTATLTDGSLNVEKSLWG